MNTKNKQYTLLTVAVAPESFTANLGFACARLNTRAEYPHFDFRKNGNVKERAFLYSYQNHQGLKQQEHLTIECLVQQNNDAVNFLIPDPREILRNWRQWRHIFSALPVNILHRSYIVPYAEYFKVVEILDALDVLANSLSTKRSVSVLPFTGVSKTDAEVDMFNQRCKQASRDFRADGSVKPRP